MGGCCCCSSISLSAKTDFLGDWLRVLGDAVDDGLSAPPVTMKNTRATHNNAGYPHSS